MGYTISKEFAFSASHQLKHLPEGHQCARMHGHNYVVKIELEADQLNEYGFVLDYAELDFIKAFIDREFDHRHLNDYFGDDPGRLTTAESLADMFVGMVASHLLRTQIAPNVTGVTAHVSETPKTWATRSVIYTNGVDPISHMKAHSPVPMAGFSPSREQFDDR